jgi:HAD superfamily hydrolase (TIGR01549 family)
MPATIKALTFDWYGTLATHRNKGRSSLFSEYLSSHGLAAAPWDRQVLYDLFAFYARAYDPDSSEDEKRVFWTEFTRRLFERFEVRGGSANHSDDHAGAIRDIFGPGCFQLYGDVQPALQRLKRRGLRLGVISNWHHGLNLFCRELGLAPVLDVVISSASVGVEKPDRRIFFEAARQVGLAPDQIAHIGDLPGDDYGGAVEAGFRGILIDRSNNHGQHPDRIESLLELERRL